MPPRKIFEAMPSRMLKHPSARQDINCLQRLPCETFCLTHAEICFQVQITSINKQKDLQTYHLVIAKIYITFGKSEIIGGGTSTPCPTQMSVTRRAIYQFPPFLHHLVFWAIATLGCNNATQGFCSCNAYFTSFHNRLLWPNIRSKVLAKVV